MRKYGAAFLDGFCDAFFNPAVWVLVIAFRLWGIVA